MALTEKPIWGPQPEIVKNDKLNAMVAYTGDRTRFIGAWAAATAYSANDIVSYNGGKWLALIASTNNTPVEGAGWTAMGGGVTIAKATTSVYGIVKLSAAPTDATQPIVVSTTQNVGGVLSGNILNPGFAVDMATQAELDNAIATRAPTAHTQTASTITDFSDAARSAMEYATGAPVQTLADLRAVAAASRQDKQQRLVEDAGVSYRFDLQGTGADNGDGVIAPTTGAGRWFKSSAAASATGNADTLGGQNAGYYLARANHTGVQPIGSVTGLQGKLDAKTETIFVDTEADIPANLAPGTTIVVGNSTASVAASGVVMEKIATLNVPEPDDGQPRFLETIVLNFTIPAGAKHLKIIGRLKTKSTYDFGGGTGIYVAINDSDRGPSGATGQGFMSGANQFSFGGVDGSGLKNDFSFEVTIFSAASDTEKIKFVRGTGVNIFDYGFSSFKYEALQAAPVSKLYFFEGYYRYLFGDVDVYAIF